MHRNSDIYQLVQDAAQDTGEANEPLGFYISPPGIPEADGGFEDNQGTVPMNTPRAMV